MPVLSNTVATCHGWLFHFNSKSWKLTSPAVALATLQVLNSHRWLEAATLDSTDVDHAHYHCRFYWTRMLMFSVPSLWASWCSGWCGEKHWQNGYKLGHWRETHQELSLCLTLYYTHDLEQLSLPEPQWHHLQMGDNALYLSGLPSTLSETMSATSLPVWKGSPKQPLAWIGHSTHVLFVCFNCLL